MKQRISLSFTGDIMCQREQLAACRTSGGYEFGPLFEPAAEALAASDYLVGNLETPFAGAEAGYTRELYSFNTPDSFAAALAACGFDLVSTANNHCLDRKLSGQKRTLDILDRAGIAHVGTALKDAVARIRLQTAPDRAVELGEFRAPDTALFDVAAVPVELAVPEGVTGHCQLRLDLLAGGREISRNYYNVFVRPKSLTTKKINTNKKTALLDVGSRADTSRTAAILKSPGIPFQIIDGRTAPAGSPSRSCRPRLKTSGNRRSMRMRCPHSSAAAARCWFLSRTTATTAVCPAV